MNGARRRPRTVVSVMDRDSWEAQTDNIVVVDAKRRRLHWIPRDLWSEVVGDRVNTAFARGGHRMLMAALAEYGLPVGGSICFRRSALERALEGFSISVPVPKPLSFWYPLRPTERIEDGRKLVTFEPPQECLTGERIHQWLGARSAVDPVAGALPDLERIERQKVFVRRLLEEQAQFSKLLEDPALVSVAGREEAFADLARVQPNWRFRTLDIVRPAAVDGKLVLVAARPKGVRHLGKLVRAMSSLRDRRDE